MIQSVLQKRIAQFADARILVIGDIIVDHFLWGTTNRISPEAPVPVVNVQREELLLGGSANVLRNIVSLGGQAALCGIIGNDAMGRKVQELVAELGVSTEGLVVGKRPTTVKTRVVAQGQQIVRFDREQTGAPSRDSLHALLNFLEKHLPRYDAIMVSDYAKGVIGEPLMVRLRQFLQEIRRHDKRSLPLIVDPKPVNMHCFVGATIITPNHYEAMQMAGIRADDERGLAAAARQIRDDLGCEAVLITRGEVGMSLLQSDDQIVTIPAMAKEVYDVTGAGDTVAATLALSLAAGSRMYEAAVLANHAAGIAVGKIGTACVTFKELAAAVLHGARG
ncbi:D-glycero-beta-D-manno-heptose-7-phosphate kinase [Desulfobulbus oligotrophicus]|uniref:D-glycero-beta-D-manno-heptose-7-phosphate kinase n=1 Tax=Desulfobulbus oligotrophicus TaxID=1909699 RepID=A0A7T6AQK0_9BACT|nr:D-glycero-beta-D-manno-heptose-7-phosphate kinase [Desulfobulbus oligotrophicus]QQG65568.1 D-glycero-beta-D-manno-heptose-7-phosphate kinase [Desulfobulbus oligotrophicus]